MLPSITDGSGKWMMATVILANTTSRTQHVQNIVNLVMANGFDGIDLDYEGFAFTDGTASWPTTEPVWIAFVTELAAALHANGKLLSVTIPPTWMEAGVVRGYPVYAPAEIGAVADRLKLMVYDWSVGSPGPDLTDVVGQPRHRLQRPDRARTTSCSWASRRTVATGVVRSTPPRSVPTVRSQRAASSWRTCKASSMPTARRHSCATTRAMCTSPTTSSRPGTARRRSRRRRTSPAPPGTSQGCTRPPTAPLQPALRLTPPTVQLSCTVRHFVYYPDAITIQMHAQAALDAGWSGVVLWALGYETPEVYTALGHTTP